jgi:hypothetical protein
VCSAARLAARGTDQGKVPRHTSIRLVFAPFPDMALAFFKGFVAFNCQFRRNGVEASKQNQFELL